MSRPSMVRALILPLGGLLAQPAMAAGQWAVGVSGGTLGLGPEVAYRFSPHLGVRANGGWYNYDDTDELDGIEYDAELKLDSVGLLLDWYPFGGGFRISLGGRINNNEVDLIGQPRTPVEIGDREFDPAQVGTLRGTLTTDSFAPSLTLGYGGTLSSGFTLGAELGVLRQGSPQIDNLRATGAVNNPSLSAELAKEARRIEADADDYEYWPVLQIHFLYRF